MPKGGHSPSLPSSAHASIFTPEEIKMTVIGLCLSGRLPTNAQFSDWKRWNEIKKKTDSKCNNQIRERVIIIRLGYILDLFAWWRRDKFGYWLWDSRPWMGSSMVVHGWSQSAYGPFTESCLWTIYFHNAYNYLIESRLFWIRVRNVPSLEVF